MRQLIRLAFILASLACSGRRPDAIALEMQAPDASTPDGGGATSVDPDGGGATSVDPDGGGATSVDPDGGATSVDPDGGGRCSGPDSSGVAAIDDSGSGDPCAKVLPPAPHDPRTFQQSDHFAGDVCGIAAGSGDGHVVWSVTWGSPSVLNDLLDVDGTLLSGSLAPQGVADLYTPQPHGFLDFAAQNHGGEVKTVVAIAGTGAAGAKQTVYNGISFPTLAVSRSGGLAVAGAIDSTPIVTFPARQRLWVFNEDASTRFGPTLLASDSTVVAAGIDASGETLVLHLDVSGELAAEWFDRDGTARTGLFQTGICTPRPESSSQQFDLVALLGSGLALRRTRADVLTVPSPWHSEWIAIFPSGVPAVAPVPAWLAARPKTSIVALPLRHAYAISAQGDASRTCSPSLEFVAADGTSCGVQEYPLDAAGTCGVSELSIGVDGTVLEPLPAAMEQSLGGADRTCTLRFWPRALQ